MSTRKPILVALIGVAVIAGCHDRGAAKPERLRATLAGGRGSFLCVAVAPDGKIVAGGNQDGSITLWDAATGAVKATLLGHGGYVFALAFSPDGRTLASGGDRTARLWDVAAARPVAVLDRHEHWVQSLAFSPDGKSLATATGSPSGVVRIWDLATHRGRVVVRQNDVKELDEPVRDISQIVFTPDGQTLVVALRTGVFLWDMGTESVRVILPTAPVTCLAVTPDGKTLANDAGNLITLRDPGTGRERGVIPDPSKSGSVAGLAFTPNSKCLVIGQALGPKFPSVVRIWDLAASRETSRFVTGTDDLRSIAIFPDGKTLATAGDDGNVKLWNVDLKR